MKPSFVTPIIEKLAAEAGVQLNIEPLYRYAGQLVLPDGRRRYFRGTAFDLNPLGASDIAKDKAYAAYFVSLLGYPVIEGESFFSPEWAQIVGIDRGPSAAYEYARHLGFPVVVKPNALSQGALVNVVYTKREFMSVVRSIAKRDRVFLVQRFVSANDYRVVVLDGTVISAYQRLPLAVVGDGHSTVRALLQAKQEQFVRQGRDTVINVDDTRITRRLRRVGMSRDSVPTPGQQVQLLYNANLSSGGDAIDVTPAIHPGFQEVAVRLTRDMGLRFCGVDVMVAGTLAEAPSAYWVLEINAAPGLDNYAQVGAAQSVVVMDLYRRIFAALLK